MLEERSMSHPWCTKSPLIHSGFPHDNDSEQHSCMCKVAPDGLQSLHSSLLEAPHSPRLEEKQQRWHGYRGREILKCLPNKVHCTFTDRNTSIPAFTHAVSGVPSYKTIPDEKQKSHFQQLKMQKYLKGGEQQYARKQCSARFLTPHHRRLQRCLQTRLQCI